MAKTKNMAPLEAITAIYETLTPKQKETFKQSLGLDQPPPPKPLDLRSACEVKGHKYKELSRTKPQMYGLVPGKLTLCCMACGNVVTRPLT